MKSAVLTGINQLEIVDVPDPCVERDTDVLLQVSAVGVCGSDVHYYETGKIGEMVVEYPYRVGHEFSGRVLETGSAVSRVKLGDCVAVDPAMPCHECDQCLGGREHTCRNLSFLGCPGQAEGCLSERIVMPETSCFPVPDTVNCEQAAVIEPLSIGLYAGRLPGSLDGSRIAILGSGPIGLSVLLPARAAGAEAIYVTDKIEARLDVARAAGADWTGNPDHTDIVSEITEREPMLLDVVFECCGEQDAMDQAVKLLKPGGSLVLVGIPRVDRVSYHIESMRRKELIIRNVRRQNACVQPAIDLVASGRVNVDFMVTHHFGLDQTQDAFDLVRDYRDGVVKAMINVAG